VNGAGVVAEAGEACGALKHCFVSAHVSKPMLRSDLRTTTGTPEKLGSWVGPGPASWGFSSDIGFVSLARGELTGPRAVPSPEFFPWRNRNGINAIYREY
jgi:hypothetical protein